MTTSENAVYRCWDQNKACVARCWEQYGQCQNKCVDRYWYHPQATDGVGNNLGSCLDDCGSWVQTCTASCQDEEEACEARAKEPAAPKRFTEQQRTNLAHLSNVAYGV